MTRFRAFIVARGSDMDASIFVDKQRWFKCACAVVFLLKKMEQMIMTSLCDVVRISHAEKGGNYKRRA